MKNTTIWQVLSAIALTAGVVIAAEGVGGAPGAAATRPAATGAAPAQAAWPLWDGKESVADYATRAGIKEAQKELDLGGGVSMKLTLIPAGKFIMGSPEGEKGRSNMETQHPVTISKPFYMGIYEVTQEQFEQVMGTNPFDGRVTSVNKGKTNPVDSMWYADAALFCEKLSAKTGLKVSLPTEAQWEYACRAGTTTRFYFGDDVADLHKYANYADASKPHPFQDKADTGWDTSDGFATAAPVGSFKPNAWGLYDMLGNIMEWCSDWCAHGDYGTGETVDPAGPEKGDIHVFRGGAWWQNTGACRCASRPGHGPKKVQGGWGFRVVVALK